MSAADAASVRDLDLAISPITQETDPDKDPPTLVVTDSDRRRQARTREILERAESALFDPCQTTLAEFLNDRPLYPADKWGRSA